MKNRLKLYNTLQKTILDFEPLHSDHVGIYWCGPTTYASSHIGHARSAIVLDTLVRTLEHLTYKVRVVRNITDVGHMLGDTDEGEDKIAHAAWRLQRSPMEVAQHYTNEYHEMLRHLGTLLPHIEPRATGHITEQITLVEKLLHKGYAYEVNGSVYFDLPSFHAKHKYGALSGRHIEELITGARALQSTSEKKSPLDFALWKKAAPEHLMRWPSPWGEGFPGWHLECTAMSRTYLGLPFDIHGGGLELCFPHHECEIAQAQAAYDTIPARYWIHHNLVTLAGKKMSKSENHFVTLTDCLTGDHPLLSQSYHPMALRLLLLQAHYRSPLDLSDHALQAAQKGYYKLINGLKIIEKIPCTPQHNPPSKPTLIDHQILTLIDQCHADLHNDLNTPKVIAHLFELLKYIHQIAQGTLPLHQLSKHTQHTLQETYTSFVQHILGLQERHTLDTPSIMALIIKTYTDAKARKDYSQVDVIRATLHQQGITLQDRKGKVTWQYI